MSRGRKGMYSLPSLALGVSTSYRRLRDNFMGCNSTVAFVKTVSGRPSAKRRTEAEDFFGDYEEEVVQYTREPSSVLEVAECCYESKKYQGLCTRCGRWCGEAVEDSPRRSGFEYVPQIQCHASPTDVVRISGNAHMSSDLGWGLEEVA
jgi:hypothetical protein